LEEIDTLFAKDEILGRLDHQQNEKDVVKQEIENIS
jgi:hypothetical protein